MLWSVRGTYLLLSSIVLFNTLAWLDSLDRYLSTRYHLELQAYLQESLFYPSRLLLSLTGRDSREDPEDAEGGKVMVAAAADHPSGQDKDIPAQAEVVLAKSTQGGQVGADFPPPVLTEDGLIAKEAPRVLFAGDSMMQGVAPLVISKTTKIFPKGYFSDQSKQSTGLTVKRYFDWPTKIKEEIAQKKFDTLVVFLGPNDPWDIMEGGKRYVFPSEDWVQKYRSRVVEVLDYAKGRGVHVIWIGLPNMRNDRVRQGAVVENQVFQAEIQRYGYDYLSTEEIFGSLGEPFRKHIDHPAKGKVAVRAEDGIHFTPEGLRLISARVVELISARRNG